MRSRAASLHPAAGNLCDPSTDGIGSDVLLVYKHKSTNNLFLLVLDLDAPAPRATTKHEQPADMFELASPADFMLHYRRPAAYRS